MSETFGVPCTAGKRRHGAWVARVGLRGDGQQQERADTQACTFVLGSLVHLLARLASCCTRGRCYCGTNARLLLAPSRHATVQAISSNNPRLDVAAAVDGEASPYALHVLPGR